MIPPPGLERPPSQPRHEPDQGGPPGLAAREQPAHSHPFWADERQRNLLPLPRPLPVLHRDLGGAAPHLGRSTRRRLQRTNHVDLECDAIAGTLNDMYLGPSCPRTNSGPSASQQASINLIRQSVLSMGPPPDDMSGPGALRALRAKSAYGEGAVIAPLSMDTVHLIDLPAVGFYLSVTRASGRGSGQRDC